jgi:hypothetical protein
MKQLIKPEMCPHCGEAIGGQKIWTDRGILLEVVGLAYRKHHLGDMSISWEELSDKLLDALCNVMGDELFNKWLEEIKKED